MQPEHAGSEGRYILVVDDDPAICEVIRMVLEDEGWTVQTAQRGGEAARAIRRRRPSLLILDLHLGSGAERDLIFDALAGSAPAVPVLVVSGDADASYAVRGVLGMAGYLPKPFDLDQLDSAVRRLMADRPSKTDDPPSPPRVAPTDRQNGGSCFSAPLSS